VNTLRKENPELIIPFTVDRDPSEPVARFSIQDHQFILREARMEPLDTADLQVHPTLKSITGICRFYLKQVRPQFEALCDSDQHRPFESGTAAFSTPEKYARELSRELGYFYTQGIAEDTKALTSRFAD